MDTAVTLGALICAPNEIIVWSKIQTALESAVDDHADDDSRKSAIVAILREAYDRGHAHISDRFRENPLASHEAVRSYTYLAESIICLAFETVTTQMHPLVVPTSSERLTLMFVGGSGRSEMAPYSDIDLLFLTPYKQTPWGETVIETTLYILWDLRLKVGYAVRSIGECLRTAIDDITIRTNLLEGRYLTGDRALAEELDERLWSDLFLKTGPEFIEAKLVEREIRHQKQGGSRYLVEPNVKESKGGLRDLQTLYWIGKYLFRTRDVADLVDQGVFTAEEHRKFEEAAAFLWTTRCLLHLIAGRASEQLTFDLQIEIAAALGFEDHDGRRGVEHFMQAYFRHAKNVGELTRLFLVDLEAKHVRSKTPITSFFRDRFRLTRDHLSPGFVQQNGRLGLARPDTFLNKPVNILRLFDEGLQSGLLIHPDAMRLVTANLDLLDEDLRHDPKANAVFMNMLLGPNNPERALRRMNELGVLGAFMPEFGRIECMMQFNMYHHYTVDEHTIQCVSILNQIEKKELVEDLPVATGILEEGVNRRILFVATLLHDIGKGLPEDHSIAGARIAAEICPRLGLSADETETVVWLVRNHLLMSDVAQKRDISDPRTVRDFARKVGDVERLKLLTVLTVCDIRGVGPGTWNNWKAVLLRELFKLGVDRLTKRADDEGRDRDALINAARGVFKKRARHLEGPALDAELGRHYAPFWLGCDVQVQLLLSKLSLTASQGAINSDIKMDKSRDATRACFAMPDHPGIFARLAGALALAGANVKDARTFTTRDGIATSVFWIQDAEGAPYEKSRLGRLRKMIEKILKGEVKATEAFKARDAVKKRHRNFEIPTEITIDNIGSELFSIIEVDTRDRPGLLHDLTRALHHMNLSISSAIIATYGHQAVDTFYVTDLMGQKLHSDAKQETVEAQLRAAIERASPQSADPGKASA